MNGVVQYQVVEGRLFSEGLHVLGQPPSPNQMRQYLSAYFGEGLPEAAVDAVVEAGDRGIEAVRQQLERTYAQVLTLDYCASHVEFVHTTLMLSLIPGEQDFARCPCWTMPKVSAKGKCWIGHVVLPLSMGDPFGKTHLKKLLQASSWGHLPGAEMRFLVF